MRVLKNFLSFCIFVSTFQDSQSQSAELMNPEEPIRQIDVKINDLKYESFDDAFFYGQWSRYAPLSQIVQVGNIGVFDSNCFNYHNYVSRYTKKINLIFYGCLDPLNRQITKHLFFIDDKNIEHNIQVQVESSSFENQWYFFQIAQWPLIQKFQIIILQYPDTIFLEELSIIYPFYDSDLILTFGGGSEFMQGSQKMSYFPGVIYLIAPSISQFDPNEKIAYEYGIDSCDKKCRTNSETKVSISNVIRENQKISYSSQYANCGYFNLAGWIRIIKITDDGKDFMYKAIKVTTNSLNSRITNDNLSPFCLYYFISENGNKIIITTYSFDFPSINLDFAQNQFLKTLELNLNNDIYLWHFISVISDDNSLSVEISFYQRQDEFKYQALCDVHQYHIVNLQVQIGNILEKMDNYIDFTSYNVQFSNCQELSFKQICHFTCFKCDGPTDTDCLTCQSNSNRVYEATIKKCICPHFSVDQLQCQTLNSLGMMMVPIVENTQECPYGYFNVNLECFQCPHQIDFKQIDCLECLNNPNEWKNMLYCQTYYVSLNQETYKLQSEEIIWYNGIQYFTFDGIQVNYCNTCSFSCSDDNCLMIAYQKLNELRLFTKIQPCRGCQTNLCDQNCEACQGQICWACYQPYYLTADKKSCKICSIKNCRYCFEFLLYDLTYTTLYEEFQRFYSIDESPIKTGCALCGQGFNYDFISEQCVFEVPKIENCLRSYVNLQGNEVCILSAIDDFSIAPQIINCEKYISNCEECVLTPTLIKKCVLCADGYVVSIINGHCELCPVENSKKCIQGDYSLYDYWVQLIQSFMMRFLPDNYFYPHPILEFYVTEFPLTCIDGYMPNRLYQCAKYCDSDCLVCEEQDEGDFYCKQCSVNYFGLQAPSQFEGQCLKCPQLCFFCEQRSAEEIQAINPYFVTTTENVKYTYKCLKAIDDQNVFVDQQLQISKYCADGICSNTLEKKYVFNFQNQKILFRGNGQYYQNQFNTIFCNEMGVKSFQMLLFFDIQGFSQKFNYLIIQTTLKALIFSLQKTSLILTCSDKNQWSNQFQIEGFDSIKINNFILVSNSQSWFTFSNNNLPIDLNIENSQFTSHNQLGVKFKVSLFKNLIFKNITLFNLNLSNIIFLEYQSKMDEDIIEISDLTIQNCFFQNVTLFSFLEHNKGIQIQRLIIKDSNLTETILIKFNKGSSNMNVNYMDNIQIQRCIVINSNLFQQQDKILQLNNLVLKNNLFLNSIIFETQFKVELVGVYILNNEFQYSFLFKAQYQNQIAIKSTFMNFHLSQNQLIESKMMYIFSQGNYLIDNQVILLNFTHENLNNIGKKELFIYDIQCYNLEINEIKIENSFNISYFRIYQTNKIIIENVMFSNPDQKQKIFIGQSCLDYKNIYATLLFVQGLQQIIMTNISLINLFTIDLPFIQIESDQLYQPSEQEYITIMKLIYKNNLILKSGQVSFSSLLQIYSLRKQLINIENIYFYQNFFHQLNDDSSESTSGLMHIYSKKSELIIKNIACTSNGLTNSSSTFLYFNIWYIDLENLLMTNSNQLTDETWSKFYKIIQSNESEDMLINQIMEQLMIINQGGVCQITSQTISIHNSHIKNIRALSTAAFSILTSGQGIVRFQNISIIHIAVGLFQTIEISGCILINSKNSKLNLLAQNMYFEEVYNRLGSAIFTINPSLTQNYISFNQIQIINCFSLLNQIVKIEFSQIQAKLNTFIMKELNFNQSLSGFKSYLGLIQFPSKEEIKSMLHDNSLINLQYCSVQINFCSFTGILFSTSLKFNSITSLIMSNIITFNIQTLLPVQLFEISPTQFSKNNIILTKITFQNISQIESDIQEQQGDFRFIRFTIKNCQIQDIEAIYSGTSNQVLKEIIKLFSSNAQVSGSFIQMSALGNETNLKINQLKLFNSNCQFCFDGLIKISTAQLPRINVQELNCYNNYIKQFGCLQIISEKLLERMGKRIIIKNSVFINNNGSSGVGIYLKSMLFKIEKSFFLKNDGNEKGGALFVTNVSNSFLLQEVIIINNQANYGGGIYLEGQIRLSQENFKSSILQFNLALLYSNNLVETPNHLTLLINGKEQQSSIDKSNNFKSLQILKFKPYVCINQGKQIISKKLLIPSQQKIKDYQLFNPKGKNYINYITQFSFIYKNSLNELLQGDYQDYCTLFKIFNQESHLNYTLENGSIFYNLSQTRFDLSDISLKINPLIQDPIKLELSCYSQNFDQQFSFQIDVNSFLCQLGEYYINEGCQICNPIQGFYSVTYNTTKCSIFDQTKFNNITSNQIQLKEGYWRPHYESDLVEMCFKNIKMCLGGWSANDDLCYPGHIGGLCEECDINNIRGLGRYHKSSGTICQICNTTYSLISFLLITFWSVSSVLVTLKSLRNSNRLFLKLKLQTRFFEIIFKQSQDFQSILLKMMLNYLWIFSVIQTFNTDFSFSFQFIDQASKPTYSMAIGLDCLLNEISNTQLVYIRIIMMLFFIMIQIIIISIGQKLISLKTNETYDLSVISNAVIYLLVSNQASIVTMFGSLLAIRNISGIDYIQGNVSLNFYDQIHQNWIYYFLLPGLCIFGIFFPFITFYILVQGKIKLNQYRFRRHLCYLYNEYVGGKYFWEQIKICKRSIIIVILIYFENSISTKAFLISAALLTYQHLAIKNKPYIINSLNNYDVQSGQIVTVSIFLAALKYISEQNEHSLLYQNIQITSIILSLLIFGLCLWLCYYFIIAIMRVYAKKYDLIILTILFDIAQKLKKDSKFTKYLNQFIRNKKQRQEQLQLNYEKLREYLLLTSRFQLDQQRNQSPLKSKRHIRLLTELDTQRILLKSRSTFSPKEQK